MVVTFKQVTAYIISALGFMSMLKPSLFDTLKGKEGGTGAFIAKEWVPNDYLELTKFPNYWNTGQAAARLGADQDLRGPADHGLGARRPGPSTSP